MLSLTSAKTDTPSVAGTARPERTKVGIDVAELAVLGAVLLVAAGHLWIKTGLNAAVRWGTPVWLGGRLMSYLEQPAVLLGLCVYATGTALWIVAVSRKQISYLFPFSALNYVLVMLGGKILFGEVIPFLRWLGVTLIVLGVVLLHRSADKGST